MSKQWWSGLAKRWLSPTMSAARRPRRRDWRLGLEELEDRSVPATIAVTTAANVVSNDADFSSVTALQSNPGSDGLISLREAIKAANANPDDDTIQLQAFTTYTFNAVDNYWYGPNALPAISTHITIEGNGATLVRDPERSNTT